MITDKIKALFQFIEFLHSNTENFKQFDEVVKELKVLCIERDKLNPLTFFKDKLKNDEIEAEINRKSKIIEEAIIQGIQSKILELNICDFNNTETLWNWNISEIRELKENFSEEDIPEILRYESKYIQYRKATNSDYYFKPFFLQNLDRILKVLFDFFSDTAKNEFEAMETKAIEVNSWQEAIEQLQKGNKKVSFQQPISKQIPAVDTRLWLTTFFEEQEQAKHEYKSFQSQIESNGCFIVKKETDTVKIYTPELAVILTSKEMPVQNMDTQTETKINGWEYLKTYIEGYKEGEQYFEKEFKVSPNTLYGDNAERYVRDIHLNFFHVKHTGINEGWGYVKKRYPIILTHKEVKEFGYYSGIVNKVEEQVKKYPQLFAAFDKCEHNLSAKQNETQTTELKIDQIALIHVYEGKQVTRDNGNEIAKQYNHSSGEKLFQRFTYFSSTANRKGKPTPCTPKKLSNKIELFKSIINHLSDNAKQRANDEVNILETIFENEYQ